MLMFDPCLGGRLDALGRVSAGYFFSISILIKSPLHTLPYKVCINHLRYTYFCLEIPKYSDKSLVSPVYCE